MIYYFDASALVKRYIREPESNKVRRLTEESAPITSRLSEVEVASAIARRCREGVLSITDQDRALETLRRDLASSFYVVELSAAIGTMTHGLFSRTSLRAGDAIQLASCLSIQQRLDLPIHFIAYDTRLNEAAQQEGLFVLH